MYFKIKKNNDESTDIDITEEEEECLLKDYG